MERIRVTTEADARTLEKNGLDRRGWNAHAACPFELSDDEFEVFCYLLLLGNAPTTGYGTTVRPVTKGET